MSGDSIECSVLVGVAQERLLGRGMKRDQHV